MPSLNKAKVPQNLLMLAALCLVLSTLDYAIPKPVPFLRIGLANLPILFALELLPVPQFFLLVLIKSLGMGVLSGTLLSYIALFSFMGSFASAAIMLALHRLLKSGVSFLGLSIAGALASNSMQLVLARYLVFGASVTYMIPLFMIASLLTGSVLGIFALQFAKKSKWLQRFLSPDSEIALMVQTEEQQAGSALLPEKKRKTAAIQIISLICIGAVLVFNSMWVSAACFAGGFLVVSIQSLRNGKRMPSVMTPILVIAGITFAHLLIPTGKVLIHVFGLPITETALITGLNRALFLEALVFLSKVSLGGYFVLPGKIGKKISQLLRLYQEFMASRPSITAGKIIEGLDTYLINVCYRPNALTIYSDTSKMES